MRVFIATLGTRGDVEPFLALGCGLQQAGHDVLFCTARRFSASITARGLSFRGVSDALLDLMGSVDGRVVMDPAGRPLAAIRSGLRLKRAANSINENMMHEYWEAARDYAPDIVLFHPKLLAAPHIAEKLLARPVLAMLQPMLVPTMHFPAAGVTALPLGGWFNRLSYAAVSAGYRSYSAAISRFRRNVLGLTEICGKSRLLEDSSGRAVSVLHGFSPHVVPRPADWPEHAWVNGYWTHAPDADWTPDKDLADFLMAGPPPVLVSFGSITGRDPKGLARTVVGALKRSEQRGIIVTGWGGLVPEKRSDSVYVLENAPYHWLLPRMAAVIHHGGAGTTAEGLRTGIPSLACPFFGDQQFWGRRIHALGAGPKPLLQHTLTEARLADAIQVMVSDTGMHTAAHVIGKKLAAEDGVTDTVALLEKFGSGEM